MSTERAEDETRRLADICAAAQLAMEMRAENRIGRKQSREALDDFNTIATPETMLALLADLSDREAQLAELEAVARQYLDTGRGDLDGVLAALHPQGSEQERDDRERR